MQLRTQMLLCQSKNIKQKVVQIVNNQLLFNQVNVSNKVRGLENEINSDADKNML